MSSTNGSKLPSDDRSPPAVGRSARQGEGDSGVLLKAGAAVGVLTTLALVGFMVWFVFTGGDTRNPDELDQLAYPPVADDICAGGQAAILALPSAGSVATPAERAELLDEANEIVADMIAALRVDVASREVVAVLPDPRSDDLSAVETALVESGALSRDDADNLASWLADYETYLGDRRAHSERLRTEGDVRFRVTDKQGNQITEWIDGYARVNDMVECEIPLDL